MSAYPPELDWRPALPITDLPPAVASAVRPVIRQLQSQLIEWRLLADRTANPTLRDALYRNLRAWRTVLDAHQPDRAGRCARCRGRWGRSSAWPCTQFTDLASALHNPMSPVHPRHHQGITQRGPDK